MQPNINRLKLLAVAFVALLAALALAPASPSTPRAAAADTKPFDAATSYKGKCSACHGKQAEKKFDATKTDDALAEVILKGKADAKPKMPAYETKGVTLDQAKALVAHMRSLRP